MKEIIMKFGWINLLGAVIVVLIMIPNIIFAVKQHKKGKARIPQIISVCEQIGRYGCIALMWLPLLVWKFSFSGKSEMMLYLLLNGILLLCYYLFWILYARQRAMPWAMALAIIPTLIFVVSGVLLSHWLLLGFAVLFGISHISITYLTHK